MLMPKRYAVIVSHLRAMVNAEKVFRLSWRMTHAELETLINSLRCGDANIEFAEPESEPEPEPEPEPDRVLRAMRLSTDALSSRQWNLFDSSDGNRAPAAWDRSTGAGIGVAVIDTGYRKHADLVSRLLPGFVVITDSKLATDGNGREADARDPGDAVAAGFCAAGSAASNRAWHGHVDGRTGGGRRGGADAVGQPQIDT
jgi:serine protease